MEFEHGRKKLTLRFGPEEVVTDLAIRTLISKGENSKVWDVIAVVPGGTRLDVLDTFYDEGEVEGMAIYRLPIGLRERVLGDPPARR